MRPTPPASHTPKYRDEDRTKDFLPVSPAGCAEHTEALIEYGNMTGPIAPISGLLHLRSEQRFSLGVLPRVIIYRWVEYVRGEVHGVITACPVI